MALAPGTRLGVYEVTAQIGAGGMGEVYRARDTKLGRTVALKILPEALSSDPERVVRFEREARTLAALNHPHIAQLYGIDSGTLVMELVEGEDLSVRLARGPIPIDEALPIAKQIADALESAHEQGIIHRDLKPANIKVRPDGTVKVLDFGLAKAMDPASSDAAPLQNSPTFTSPAMTMRGAILGTAAYMSPEQAKGKEVDRRADIWAFGVVLYEMLTGRSPFAGDSAAETIGLVVTRDPDWSALPPTTPAYVRSLLFRCLERQTRTRLRDIGEARVALEAPPPPTMAAATTPLAASRSLSLQTLSWALAAVLAIAPIAGWLVTRRGEVIATPLHLTVPIPTGLVEAATIENLSIAISRDGLTVAYCARDAGVVRLYVKRLDRRDTVALHGTEGAQNPFFSPDGQWVGFFSGGKLRKVPVDGGSPIAVADAADDRAGVWLADDTIVFAPSFVGPLMQVSASGGVARDVTTLDAARSERTHRWPDALPGSDWVLFTIGSIDRPNGYDDSDIGIVSVKTGDRRTLFSGASSARFLPPDRVLVVRTGEVFSVGFDAVAGKTIGPPVRILDAIAMESTSGGAHLAVAHTGTLAYLSEDASAAQDELLWIDRAGTITPVASDLGSMVMPRLSADGRRVLVGSGIAPASGRGDLWAIDLATGASTRLTFNQASVMGIWTPDQRHIVYYSENPQPSRVMIKAADGSGPERPLYSPTEPIVPTGFTPDGRALLMAPYGSADTDVLMVPLDGSGKATTVIGGPRQQFGGTVSPDGRWIAYAANEFVGQSEIFAQAYPSGGGRWQISRGGGFAPQWSANGRELFYVSDSQLMVASIEASGGALATGAPRRLFTLPPTRFQTTDFRLYDAAADGSKFLVTRRAGAQLDRRSINIALNAVPPSR